MHHIPVQLRHMALSFSPSSSSSCFVYQMRMKCMGLNGMDVEWRSCLHEKDGKKTGWKRESLVVQIRFLFFFISLFLLFIFFFFFLTRSFSLFRLPPLALISCSHRNEWIMLKRWAPHFGYLHTYRYIHRIYVEDGIFVIYLYVVYVCWLGLLYWNLTQTHKTVHSTYTIYIYHHPCSTSLSARDILSLRGVIQHEDLGLFFFHSPSHTLFGSFSFFGEFFCVTFMVWPLELIYLILFFSSFANSRGIGERLHLRC